jgi:N-methylhydantoinase B
MRLASRFGDQPLQKNDVVRVERPGGGGLGDPLTRPVDNVIEDVRQGYVSAERARADYGVALDFAGGEPILDEGQTRALRGNK